MKRLGKLIEFVGGPLDGILTPLPSDYLKEGDYEAVNTLEWQKPGSKWSAESVYHFVNGKLLYDQEATNKYNAAGKTP